MKGHSLDYTKLDLRHSNDEVSVSHLMPLGCKGCKSTTTG